MASAFTCLCGVHFRNPTAIAKHKQYCATVQKDISQNCNFLLSTATNDVGRGGVDDSDGATHVFDSYFASYDDVDCSSYHEEDDVGRGGVDDSDGATHVFDSYFASYDDVDCSSNHEEDDVEKENRDLSDSDEDDDDKHSASLSIGEHQRMNNEEDDSTSESDDEDDDGYSRSDDSMSCDDPIPGYDKPLFSPKQPHLSAAYQLQAHLNSLFDKNKASVQMYDEMVKLFNAYISSPQFSKNTLLRPRKHFISESENLFSIQALKPRNGTVKMTDNTLVTVPVFDAKAMILSILHDPVLMKEENFAEGYDIFTGAEIEGCAANNKYGEIHTGDAWKPALTRFCGSNGEYMPIALVLFGDKSHTDLHGLLSVEPVSFTLSLFNRSARNLPQFWRLLGYVPNLSAGKGEANRMSATDKIQNEHNCLAFILKSVIDINNRGGNSNHSARTRSPHKSVDTLHHWRH